MMVISRSDQFRIQRMHRSNTTRWMHDSDDIIPIREPEHASWKVLFQGIGLMCAMTVLLFLVWWYGG